MLPHYKVFTRLGISKIHDIGVFAISDIPQNTPLFEFDNTEMVWIDASTIEHIPSKLKKFYTDFCVYKNSEKVYGCPVNFNQLTMAWYMNESTKPNVKIDKDYNFTSNRLIKEGEELTINYSDFEKI